MSFYQKKQHIAIIMKSNLLYKLVNDSELLVISVTLQREAIRQAHEKSHFSVNKSKEVMEKEHYNPNLDEKIRKYISCCKPSIVSNRKQGRQGGELYPIKKEEEPL